MHHYLLAPSFSLAMKESKGALKDYLRRTKGEFVFIALIFFDVPFHHIVCRRMRPYKYVRTREYGAKILFLIEKSLSKSYFYII